MVRSEPLSGRRQRVAQQGRRRGPVQIDQPSLDPRHARDEVEAGEARDVRPEVRVFRRPGLRRDGQERERLVLGRWDARLREM